MSRRTRRLPRVVLAAAIVAAIFPAVPAGASAVSNGPAGPRIRTIESPRTMARSFTLDRAGAVSPEWPATHIGFSWKGDEG
ncbi:MAG TPA: hypothetical protein VEV43_01945, partial [Actinomycetota bacterium]|nr:hypothetical protein [Actinomycetota bacterium]